MNRLAIFLIFIALVGVGVLGYFGFTQWTGAAVADGADEALVEILNLEGCDGGESAYESCCISKCNAFCAKNGQTYANHFVNVMHCSCWCDL